MDVVNTIFQIMFIAIMSIGILGLPLYFYLMSRKKRIIEESKQNSDLKANDETEE